MSVSIWTRDMVLVRRLLSNPRRAGSPHMGSRSARGNVFGTFSVMARKRNPQWMRMLLALVWHLPVRVRIRFVYKRYLGKRSRTRLCLQYDWTSQQNVRFGVHHLAGIQRGAPRMKREARRQGVVLLLGKFRSAANCCLRVRLISLNLSVSTVCGAKRTETCLDFLARDDDEGTTVAVVGAG